MIHFRCWFCNKRHARPREKAGERFLCSCERLVRIPRRGGGNSKTRTLVDWLVEAIAYGGGGALLGFGFAVLIVARFIRPAPLGDAWIMITGWTVGGFLVGLFFGERGVTWIGRMIRDEEER